MITDAKVIYYIGTAIRANGDLLADQYKPEMPAITVSALMDGYGRQLANFLKPTYMFQLDFDHVKKEDMVIEKEPIELNSDAAVDPTDTFED